jgi:ribosome recycling factor
MAVDPILREAEDKMRKSVEALQRDLTTIRTGRANPSLIDRVVVSYYGTPTPLNQLAQISTPEARMLLVNVYDRNAVASVEKALRAPEVGLNPSSDGNVIRVPIPSLTEERRRDYVKLVRQKAEDARVAIRNIRRDELHRVDRLAKDGEIPDDDAHRAHDRLQKITDTHVDAVDQLATRKEAEVMEV